MGRFFTSTQINNPKQLNCDGFKAYFCEKMKKDGYEVCEADCAELSYVLAFSKNCKWVTLSSESYEQGNRTAQADTARIAKMLGTYCVNTIVIDSDCAMLDLYDDKGKKADTLVMGRADDYLGDDIPAPAQAVWEQFVSPDSTWEQFMSVVQGDYVFVEDGLSELAPVIEMDSGNILFEYDDADESNEKLCYLSFKKTASKKEKKPTLNSLFQQIWGAELEPLGFKKPKLRLPYYIRVINDEIIHVVGIHDMKSHLVAFGGIATVYRKELCLNHSFRQNERWLRDVMDFYVTWRISDKPFNQEIQSGFHYHEYIESQPLSKAVQDALNETMTWIVPVLDNIKTLKDVADYQERVFKNYISIISLPLNDPLVAPYSDAAIKFILDDPLADLEQRYLTSLKLIDEENIRYNRTQEYILRNQKEYEQRYNESCKNLHMFLEDEEMHSQTLEELARRKKYNLEMLKSYGIDSEKTQPKKEKKLTLNAAFKQVFGEALEPLGFIKAKTHHPCFLRAVGDEIIHVINLSCCGTRISTNSGVMTVYRPKIDLNDHKWDNKWLYSTEKFYSKINVVSFDEKYWNENLKIEYTLDNEESLINALKKALEEVKKWVLPILNDVKTVKDIIDYQHRLGVTAQYFAVCDNIYLNHETPCSDGAILFALDDPYYYPKRIKELLQTQLDFEIEHGIHFFGKETYEETCERFDKNLAERIAQIDDVINNKHFYEQTIAELQRRKKANLEILKSYGIDSEKTQPKKEKKLTLNAAFKQVFGEGLEPLGFVRLKKTKLPFYVRLIEGEILQIITYRKKSIKKSGYERFEVLGGIVSLYRREINFEQPPESWLYTNGRYYSSKCAVPVDIMLKKSVIQFHCDIWGTSMQLYSEPAALEEKFQMNISNFLCKKDDNEEMLKGLKNAFTVTSKIMLSIFEKVTDCNSCIDYFYNMDTMMSLCEDFEQLNTKPDYYDSDGLILIKANYRGDISHYRERKLALEVDQIEKGCRGLYGAKDIEEYKERFRHYTAEQIIIRDKMLDDFELNAKAIEELARRKKANLEMLKSYGIDSEKTQPKKEKKLTLNAAFKQVFGELLEPMGFKLVKSKYPYYLRVVGEGIIQAISFAKKKSLNLDLNRDEEEVEIYVGISLLSNPLINFDKNPTIIDNQVWMISLNELYRRFIVYMDGFNRKHEEYSFFYQKGNIEEVLNALKQSRDELMPFVLEFLEKPKTLEDIYRLGEITSGIRHDTIILLQKIDELIKELKENLTKKIEMLESVHKDNPERLELLKKRAIEGSEKSIEYFDSFKKGGEKYDDYIKTAEKTKEDNLEKLKQLGIL